MGGGAIVTVALTATSFAIQPRLSERFASAPWGFVFPTMSIAGLPGIRWSQSTANELRPFLSSSTYLLGMLTECILTRYLPARTLGSV